MSATWELTDLEFRTLCEDHHQGRLPRPLVFTSTIRWADEFAAALARTRGELRERYAGDLDAFGAALARPDVFITLQGFGDDLDFDDPAQRTRVHALRQRARGFVITQWPGEERDGAAGFEIDECDPHALAEVVVSRIPFGQAGQLPGMPIPDTARDRGAEAGRTVFGSMIADDDAEDDDYERAMAFLRTPATRTGTLRVVQGRSKYGPRGRIAMGLLWRDTPGDGRYVMPLDSPAPTATAMGSNRMTEWVHEQVDLIVNRLDRNMETEE